ncbi:hemagglutinin [Xanthomonas oryzae pv. oryzae KACC 10331]|uniref:Hemagglutinin n=22 Tax=Xanthomonas oryzae TaxID=347 RepID=Q5GU94_XANOR|nr:hemagglutinin [Xanthomonas oryzae pv. oryzae KACC 10331]
MTLSQTNTSATTVNLTRSGTATSGTDYTGAVTSVMVPANTASASFSVTPVADTTVETDETVTFQVASGTGYSTGSPSSATATIVNDDFPSASIAVSPASVTEDGATNLLYTVTLNQPSPTALSIGFGVGGTATSGTDYAAVNSPLVIAAGQTTGTITINPTADSTVEPDETVVISLNAGSGYTVGSPNSATGTILNDDAVVTISPALLPAATAGSAYSQTLSASGGTPGYTFVVSAGTLPAGLTLSASGVLSGTPTASGSFNFTVTATDSGAPTSGSRAYTLTVAGANVTLPATTLPAGTAGQAYSSAITPATGGIAPYSYALTAGALPAGITLNTSSGTLSGTTTSVGSFNFTVTATDSTSGTPSQGTRGYTLNIAAPTIAVAPSTVPTATRGTAYSQTLTASGGTAAYTYAITSGALPAGITLASNGTLSGTATLEGTFNFTVQATDANSFTGTQAYSLIVAGPNLVLPASTLPAGTAGQAYAAAIAPATGGTAPYSYAVTAGALPGGVVLDAATGGLSGTPTVSGTFTFTLTVTDSTPSPAAQASRSYALTVNAATLVLGQPTLPAAVRGTAYSQVLTASGGIAPYRYSIASGTLSGTPTVQGTSSFTIAVADAGNATATPGIHLHRERCGAGGGGRCCRHHDRHRRDRSGHRQRHRQHHRDRHCQRTHQRHGRGQRAGSGLYAERRLYRHRRAELYRHRRRRHLGRGDVDHHGQRAAGGGVGDCSGSAGRSATGGHHPSRHRWAVRGRCGGCGTAGLGRYRHHHPRGRHCHCGGGACLRPVAGSHCNGRSADLYPDLYAQPGLRRSGHGAVHLVQRSCHLGPGQCGVHHRAMACPERGCGSAWPDRCAVRVHAAICAGADRQLPAPPGGHASRRWQLHQRSELPADLALPPGRARHQWAAVQPGHAGRRQRLPRRARSCQQHRQQRADAGRPGSVGGRRDPLGQPEPADQQQRGGIPDRWVERGCRLPCCLVAGDRCGPGLGPRRQRCRQQRQP